MEELLTLYTLKELSELEWKNPRTIKGSYRYLKVKIETSTSRFMNRTGLTKKSYWVKYIRLEDVKKLLNWKVDFTYLTAK